MKPERWRRIEEIYCGALELEPARREAFLDQSCAGDASIRREVGRLLEDRQEAEIFMESPAVEVAARALFRSPSDSSSEGAENACAGVTNDEAQHRRRAPWWVYLVALPFLICLCVHIYARSAGPSNFPVRIRPVKDPGGSVVGAQLVSMDSTLGKAGLQLGDLILVSGSDGFLTVDGLLNIRYWQAGRTYRMTIDRNGETRTILLTMPRRQFMSFNSMEWAMTHLRCVLFMVMAIIVVYKKPFDLSARWGALVMAMVALQPMTVVYPRGLVSTMQNLSPVFVWPTVLIPSIILGTLGSVWITFFSVFPRRLFQRRWIWAVIWLPSLILLPPNFLSDHPPAYQFPIRYPDWFGFTVQVLALFMYLAIAAVVFLSYRNCRDLNEKRRMRLVAIGFAIYLLTTLPAMGLLIGGPFAWMFMLANTRFGAKLTHYLEFVFPITVIYAILRHRLFDIRFMIRQGVRYAVGRGVLLSLVPIVGIAFAVDLYLYRSQPLGEIMSRRGLLYGVLAGGGLVLHTYRRKWLAALDRRFFREQYNAQRVLKTVIDDIRTARSFEKVAPRVVLQIETSLHPKFAGILVRPVGESAFQVLAGGSRTLASIGADSSLMRLVRTMDKAVEISQEETGWPWSHLPDGESAFLRRTEIEWIFPISLTEGRSEGILVVGPKRSESPYTQEDRELLEGIASSLGLLLEQSPAIDTDTSGFKECPECGTCYDSDSDSCGKEGSALTQLPYPRLLVRRYRFEQRLGKGGMGVVYQSLDMELQRQVAIKLIHPDLMSSVEAAARFKQEARAAAGFTHPNVVTIYDFDVAADGRAYLVMELLKGVTLRQELKRVHRLTPFRAIEIFTGVCAAVETAHGRKLLHRDLKPENIFLTNSGQSVAAKILDFGVVKTLAQSDEATMEGQTEPGRLVGTPKYMSPEELRGERPKEGWDLWAVAVVAYEMLTGEHPFKGATSSEVRTNILDGKVTPLDRHLPEAPESWQRFFNRALACDAASRPQSAVQLLHDFKQSIQ